MLFRSWRRRVPKRIDPTLTGFVVVTRGVLAVIAQPAPAEECVDVLVRIGDRDAVGSALDRPGHAWASGGGSAWAIVRAITRRTPRNFSSGPISYLQVGSDLGNSQLQILYERYQPGADTGQSMLSHDAEEGGIVLKGRLEVTVGEQVQTLSAGDAYRFNSKLPHRFRNTGNEECVIVSACTPPSF